MPGAPCFAVLHQLVRVDAEKIIFSAADDDDDLDSSSIVGCVFLFEQSVAKRQPVINSHLIFSSQLGCAVVLCTSDNRLIFSPLLL